MGLCHVRWCLPFFLRLLLRVLSISFFFFFFNDTATTEIYTLSLHDALPICLLESLDPQSSYLSPREYAEFKLKSRNGAKGEAGVTLSKRFGYIVVVAVLPDSPAQKAGLRYGDILEAIAGFTTREMSLGQAQILLAGDPGTAVKVAVVGRGRTEPREVELVRGPAALPPVLSEKPEPDIAYLRFSSLEPGKANEIREKLQQFDKQGIHKLVLDLRDCARGEVSEAVATARLFLNS